jgi:hypothetical protein
MNYLQINELGMANEDLDYFSSHGDVDNALVFHVLRFEK